MRLSKCLIVCLILGLSLTGCKLMMYPLARAFGGMKESEIKRNRAAFAVMKEKIRTGTIVVYPALVIKGGEASWDTTAGRMLGEALRGDHGLAVTMADREPGVPYAPMKRNQLRYRNERARACAAWMHSQPKTGDYYWFSEIFMDSSGEEIFAIQAYVVDAAGMIPYAGLANSHHFAPAHPWGVTEGIRYIIRRFFKDLDRKPEELWPPYGIG